MFFVVSALKKLLLDENLKTLLRAEGLDSMPAFLVDKVLAAQQAQI
jgi:ParB family chromosome partitioning protein